METTAAHNQERIIPVKRFPFVEIGGIIAGIHLKVTHYPAIELR